MAGGERSLYTQRSVVCARLQICRAPLSSPENLVLRVAGKWAAAFCHERPPKFLQ
jgi:hypothetical protein